MAAASSSSGPDTAEDAVDGLRAKNCGRDPAMSKLWVHSGGMVTDRSETTVRFWLQKSASVYLFRRRRAATVDVGEARSKIRHDRSMRSGVAGRVPLAVARERELIAQLYEPEATICGVGQDARPGLVHPYPEVQAPIARPVHLPRRAHRPRAHRIAPPVPITGRPAWLRAVALDETTSSLNTASAAGTFARDRPAKEEVLKIEVVRTTGRYRSVRSDQRTAPATLGRCASDVVESG